MVNPDVLKEHCILHILWSPTSSPRLTLYLSPCLGKSRNWLLPTLLSRFLSWHVLQTASHIMHPWRVPTHLKNGLSDIYAHWYLRVRLLSVGLYWVGWSALAQLCWPILWTILQAKLYKVLYSGLYCALWQVLKGDKTRTAVLHQNHIDIGFQFGPQCMSVCASLHTNVCDITDKFVRHCIELHLIVLHSLHQCVRHCISMYFNGL